MVVFAQPSIHATTTVPGFAKVVVQLLDRLESEHVGSPLNCGFVCIY